MVRRNEMTWPQAVAAMRQGDYVRRAADMVRRPYPDAPGIVGTGPEAIYLAHAWADDDNPVRVYLGAESRLPFVPDGDDMSATDWLITNRQGE